MNTNVKDSGLILFIVRTGLTADTLGKVVQFNEYPGAHQANGVP